MLVLATLDIIMLLPIMPRFIMNIRKLHNRDLQSRLQGTDTGFGVSSMPNCNSGCRGVCDRVRRSRVDLARAKGAG